MLAFQELDTTEMKYKNISPIQNHIKRMLRLLFGRLQIESCIGSICTLEKISYSKSSFGKSTKYTAIFTSNIQHGSIEKDHFFCMTTAGCHFRKGLWRNWINSVMKLYFTQLTHQTSFRFSSISTIFTMMVTAS